MKKELNVHKWAKSSFNNNLGFFCLVLVLLTWPKVANSICPLSATKPKAQESQCRMGLNKSEIICDGENITTWNYGELPSEMDTLRINKTRITLWPECALAGLKIKTLVIEDNLMLRHFDDSSLDAIQGVEKVIISRNPLLELTSPFRFFATMKGLKDLVLEENFIQGNQHETTFPLFLTNLTFLSLKGNPLRGIATDFFKPLVGSNLFELDMQDCYLETIEPGVFLVNIDILARVQIRIYCLDRKNV